jgi:HD-GYP domain-containing protein (c-di-GMP phosphodiesterase class II)
MRFSLRTNRGSVSGHPGMGVLVTFLAVILANGAAGSSLPTVCVLAGRLAPLLRKSPGTDRIFLGPQAKAVADWAKSHEGRLDLLLLEGPSGSYTSLPTLTDTAQVLPAFEALSDFPQAQLALLTKFPEVFGNAREWKRDLARDLIDQANDNVPEFFADAKASLAKERFLAALEIIQSVGTEDDLINCGKMGDWFHDTVEGVREHLQHAHPSGNPSADNLTFVANVFRDVATHIPDIRFHTEHSDRVAEALVKLYSRIRRVKNLPPLTSEEVTLIREAGQVHDFGKALWPEDLIARRTRLGLERYRELVEEIEWAEKGGYLVTELASSYKTALKELNQKVGEDGKLTPATEQQRQAVASMDALGYLKEREGDLLVATELPRGKDGLSEADQARIKEHAAAGARLLLLLDPQGSAAKLAQLHHDYLNGTGYFGVNRTLLRQEIQDSDLIQALTVVDYYDALTHKRPNSPKPLSPQQAFRQLGKWVKEGRLNRRFVKLFIESVRSEMRHPKPSPNPNPFDLKSRF